MKKTKQKGEIKKKMKSKKTIIFIYLLVLIRKINKNEIMKKIKKNIKRAREISFFINLYFQE